MKEIGGYFELELRQGKHYHQGALQLNTARNCFEYILRARKYSKIYIPYYTCEVLLEPIIKCNVEYEFYPIDLTLEPKTLPILHSNEAFLYTNYYGLKQAYIETLAAHYGSQLIVDNSQAFFAPALSDIDTFYSARKFFGVPDGAYLYTTAPTDLSLPTFVSFHNMGHLLVRADSNAEAGYKAFQDNEEALCHAPISIMSNLSQKILCGIDYEQVQQQRRDNYQTLAAALGKSNKLQLTLPVDDVPMVYPFLTTDDTLRARLIQNKIFIPTYWQNVLQWTNEQQFLERQLVQYLLPLPIDQRYNAQDMQIIISHINTL